MLIIGIAGHTLAAQERDWLQHPAVGGVLLFGRNVASRQQVIELNAQLRDAAPRPLLLCVDQEGGPVQRMRTDFSRLPELARFGTLHDTDPDAARRQAAEHAWLMASEMRAVGVDLSFAPVVDLKRGNRAIGDRAFHMQPQVVADLAAAYVRGLHDAGMAATLKHFPGHGSVLEDTHVAAAIDPRPLHELEAADLLPFRAGIAAGADAVMMAHVAYPAVDADPAGYSRRWIDYLRTTLGFRGAVISDDIGMAAAGSVGGVAARLHAHYDAGCDIVLACWPELVPDALAAAQTRTLAPHAITPLLARGKTHDWTTLTADARWSDTRASLALDPIEPDLTA